MITPSTTFGHSSTPPEPESVVPAFLSGGRIQGNTPEPVLERLIEIAEHIFLTLLRDRPDPVAFGAKVRQLAALTEFADILPCAGPEIAPVIPALLARDVVDQAAHPGELLERLFLFGRRAEFVAIAAIDRVHARIVFRDPGEGNMRPKQGRQAAGGTRKGGLTPRRARSMKRSGRNRKGNPMREETASRGDGIVETFKTIIWALIIAGVFRILFFQPFWIPSGSMKDTLLIGDFLFVNKMAYGYSRYSCPFALCPFSGRILDREPERGDVIVFRHPSNGQDYIKRLIGLPGDSVQVSGGQIVLNGRPVPQEPAGDFIEIHAPQGSARTYPECRNRITNPCIKERSLETLPEGVTHDVLNIGNRQMDDTGVYRVPEGQYFFMGDNRDNSTDSRVPQPRGVGFVPHENLIGRADRVVFSSAGRSMFFFWTWRGDRFFKAIE